MALLVSRANTDQNNSENTQVAVRYQFSYILNSVIHFFLNEGLKMIIIFTVNHSSISIIEYFWGYNISKKQWKMAKMGKCDIF